MSLGAPGLLAPREALAQNLGNLVEVATGLSSPIYATTDPTNNTRVFIVERGGQIKIVLNGTLQATPFLDVSAVLTPSSGSVVIGGTTYTVSRYSEQGLLGLAFAPDYATSGTFYVNFVARRYMTIPSPPSSADYSFGCSGTSCTLYDLGRTVVAKMQRDPANPNRALLQTVTDLSQIDAILKVDQPFTNHNGGNIQFGPDGFMYIGMGDGGSGNDPGNRALNPALLFGKMLRIDPSGDDFPADPDRDYRIPAGNPYASGGGAPEVWARGLRNPWRWSFDRLTGDLWIGDVGQDLWEEVDVVPGNGGPGRNYGWRVREGLRVTGLSAGSFDVSSLTDPVYVYPHDGTTLGGYAVTGGYVYRGKAIPAWRGRYFFADYVSRRVWSARMINGTWADFQDNTDGLNNLGTSNTLVIRDVSSFGEDNDGELFIVQLNGRVRKLVRNPSFTWCAADVDDGSLLGHPDGSVTIDDLVFYLRLFEAGDARADLDNGNNTGTFDNAVTIDDLVFFLRRFEAGC